MTVKLEDYASEPRVGCHRYLKFFRLFPKYLHAEEADKERTHLSC